MESSVQDVKSDLESGEGLYEPIVVAYDPENGYAIVAEGNHRVEAAIQAGEEFIPVVVITGNVSTKKDGEATPELVEKNPGSRFEADMTQEVNPYFIFPDSDILEISRDKDVSLDQDVSTLQGVPADYEIDEFLDDPEYGDTTIFSPDGSVVVRISRDGYGGIDVDVESNGKFVGYGSIGDSDKSGIYETIEEILSENGIVLSEKQSFDKWATDAVFAPAGSSLSNSSELSSLLLKDPDRGITLEMQLVRDPNGRTLADITGLPQDSKYKLYRSDGVEIYNVEGVEYENVYKAEEALLDSGVEEEDLDDALNDSIETLIEHGTYALSDEAENFEFTDRVGRFKLDDETTDNLTSEEFAAMRTYTASSDKINSDLRNGEEPGAKISLVDSLIQKLGKRVFGPLFRGVNFSPEEWGKQNLKVGDRISDPALMSTTQDRSVAERFSLSSVEYATGIKSTEDSSIKVVYKINLSPEEKALKIDAKFLPPASESEFILPRDISFEVADISDNGRFRVVELKQVSSVESPDLNQGLPGVAESEAKISADSLKDRIDTLFDRLRGDLTSLPKSEPEKVSKSEVTTRVARDVSSNKSVVSLVLQEIQDAFKSPAQWIRNFSRRGRSNPVNPLSNQEYKAFNLVALSAAADRAGYSDPRWLSQAEAEKGYGASLKGDATPTNIAVPVLHSYEDEDGNKFESVRFERVQVYNAEQFDDMPTYDAPETVKYTPGEAFEVILDRFNNAEIERKRRGIPSILGMKMDGSSVTPDTGKVVKTPNYFRDKITLPLRSQFKTDEAWVQSLAHELIHSTGAKYRVDREEFDGAGTSPEARAREEVIAEMASAMLMKMFNLDYDTKNSANYIKFQTLKEGLSDSDIEDASIKAQAAIDYLLGNDIDTMPKWDPTTTKRPKTPTEFRNTELTPLYSSINPDVSQSSVNSLDLPIQNVSLDQGVKNSVDAKQKVLDSLVQKLKDLKGRKIPWRKPFTDGFEFTGGSGMPRNPSSKIIYSGFNSFFLKISAMHKGYNDSRWMTFNQAKELGGSVRKGEKAEFILRPMKSVMTQKDKSGKPVVDENGKEKQFGRIWFKTIAVFNVEQIDGLNLPDDVPTTTMKPVDAQDFIIERYIKSMEAKGIIPPKIDYSYVGNYGDHATSPNWSPFNDSITLPGQAQFNSPEEMFDTLMHELTHSTGDKRRLDRSELTKDYANPDGQARAQEELIAEMGAAMLGEMFGVNYDVDNTQAYMQSWFSVLTGENPDILQLAASKAQQAVDYMLGMDLGDWSPLEGYTNYLGKQGKEGNEE